MRARRTAAVLVSVLFCPTAFALLWVTVLYTPAEIRTVMFGYPLLTAAYFLIAGGLFRKKLELRRLTLWLWMALPGYFLCWVVLAVWLPDLLQNGMLLILFLSLTCIQIPVWLGVLLVEGTVRLLRRTKIKSP